MEKHKSRSEFVSLLAFLVAFVLVFTNGFSQRIFAQEESEDVYQQIEPVGDVLDKIQTDYVMRADLDKLVQGALIGIMSSLDRHSSFINAQDLETMREDTKGEFFGIGVSIKPDDNNNIMVFAPIEGSPAAEAGLLPGDLIIAIDGISTEGMTTADAADKIRGPKGTPVKLTLLRKKNGGGEPDILEVSVKRDKVPLESVKEARILDGGIGYMRISDFKENTAGDMKERLKKFVDQGMRAFILDLRWNPGGLLNASKEVSELFLPKGSLVTYTKGRERDEHRKNPDDMELYTEDRPVLPPEMPIVVLVNESTASSSEIVTGALQYHQRGLILGEKTFGKGSVQTIIPLVKPVSTALRLTTALYYTPADVTINHQGILPDLEVPMSIEEERELWVQLVTSAAEDPARTHEQNHGSITNGVHEQPAKSQEKLAREEALLVQIQDEFGAEAADALREYVKGEEKKQATIEDTQLERAVAILREDSVWEHLIQKYHRDVHETQVAADVTSERSEEERLLVIEASVQGEEQAPAPTSKDESAPKGEEKPAPAPSL
ncbi:MAG: S41 family peptidase [Candidatus Hydrogenedentes bacterium]|nr:S41 family peptidase [Candidatus Hydrogenedentota bacterium]